MPTTSDLFPYGEADGNCHSCGCAVAADQQQRHLTWHQEIFTAAGVN